jgi:hypothetical protein
MRFPVFLGGQDHQQETGAAHKQGRNRPEHAGTGPPTGDPKSEFDIKNTPSPNPLFFQKTGAYILPNAPTLGGGA